jgi:hypothetical protein
VASELHFVSFRVIWIIREDPGLPPGSADILKFMGTWAEQVPAFLEVKAETHFWQDSDPPPQRQRTLLASAELFPSHLRRWHLPAESR